MIVYADRRESLAPRPMLEGLLARLSASSAACPGPDDLSALLIDGGILEAALVDALSPEADDDPPPATILRRATTDLAHAVRLGSCPEASMRLGAAGEALARVARGPLPARVEATEPEGFAFYALYPEMVLEAARRFARSERPDCALCVGVRSIGTTLSALVASILEAEGVAVRSVTVRPRGHPFERELRLGPRLRAAFAEGAGGHVLIVDEGPGISGSSFACAAEAASAAGASDNRIALFPSWDADGTGLRSARARDRFARHPRWVASFEDVVLGDGRLTAPWSGGDLRDLSGGLWRDLLPPGAPIPAVQPQHERRKYLLAQGDAPPILLKFAGLGRRGRTALARASRQAEAGLAPQVLGLHDGFLAFRWMKGRPTRRGEEDAPLLDAIARHVAFLATHEPAPGPPRVAQMLAMLRANAGEGLGEDALAGTEWLDRAAGEASARPAIAGDGRMLPHEWLRTSGAILKCDGLDHCADHFAPGAQDPAWDLAGAAVEFGLGPAARAGLLARYETRTGDAGIQAVLPFFEAGYLAWRLGYATLAAEVLGSGPDARRFQASRDGYAAHLRRALAEPSPWAAGAAA